MSDPVVIALIMGVQSVITAGLAAWLKKGQDSNHEETMAATETVRKDVNGKMQQLLNTTGDAREAKGNLVGRAEAKTEAAAEDAKQLGKI